MHDSAIGSFKTNSAIKRERRANGVSLHIH